MPDKNKPFVVTDRRRFNSEGESRPDAHPTHERERHDIPATITSKESKLEQVAAAPPQQEAEDPNLPPPPSAEQIEQALAAYRATADRLDVAVRAANPGLDHPPAMSFDQLVQSVYMQAILQLGGGTQEGQQPQVDILGARQSVDMLGVLAEKTTGNLTPDEQRLLDSALFELRLAFLEITQALARSAQARQAAPPPSGSGPRPGGPSIVR